MKIIMPSQDLEKSRQSAIQALYTLIMDTATAAAQGIEPQQGADQMPRLEATHVVDTFLHLVEVYTHPHNIRELCPMCQSMVGHLIREQDLKITVITEGIAGLGSTTVVVHHLPTGLAFTATGTESQLQLKAQAIRGLQELVIERNNQEEQNG